MKKRVESRADELAGREAEHRVRRRRDEAEGEIGLDDGDQVLRVLDERAEPRLGAPLEDVVGTVRALEGGRDLLSESEERVAERLGRCATGCNPQDAGGAI